MELVPVQKRKAYLIIGTIGLVFSVGYLGMSLQFPLGKMSEPGAGVFPLVVGTMLIVGSFVTLWEGWQLDKIVQITLPSSTYRQRLLRLIGLLFSYIVLLPWLGQFIVSTLFCILMLRLFSDLGWLRILVYSLMISISFYMVFIMGLKVPMPHGELISYF